MDKRGFSAREILAGEAPKDGPVTVKGWVRTRRDSKAGISFVHLSDGSSFHPLQVVAPNTLANYTGEVLRLTAGCAVEATGIIAPSPAKGQPFEMQASALRVIGWIDDPDTYPIQPKPHTLEFLREVAHLRPRSNTIGAATRVRHTLAQAIHRFFDENGFFWVNTPIITGADAEGAGAMFRVSTLDFANLPRTPEGKIDYSQDFFGRGALIAKLQGIVGSEFVRLDYGEAIQVLEPSNQKFEFPVKWGVDLQSEHERYLTEQYAKKPVVVMNYPKDIKAFYMRVNDDGRTVAAMDVLAPGMGEIIGGSQREERLDVLDRSMAERGIDKEHYGWYRDLRRYGK